MYYVCPVAGNGIWQRNVRALRKREDLFNGNRVVAVATINRIPGITVHRKNERKLKLDSLEKVQEAFGGDYNVFPVRNVPHAPEASAWPELCKRCITTFDTNNFTFYGHAKGVTYSGDPLAVLLWTSMLYSGNLDYWPMIEKCLEDHSTAGILKMPYDWQNIVSPYHYSGTFFWLKNSALVGTDFTKADMVYPGVEIWPGQKFPETQGGNIFGGYVGGMYGPSVQTNLAAQFTDWSNTNQQFRRPDASPTPWVEFQYG